MATRAPTGTATSPPSTRASTQGTPCSTWSCENATAPMAANVAWHSDTCPDVRTSRPRDSSITTVTRATVKNGSLAAHQVGDQRERHEHRRARRRAAPAPATGTGARAGPRPSSGGTSRLLGSTSSTTNSTRNGSASGNPASHGVFSTYFFEMSEPMPMSTPPRNVSGMLEKPRSPPRRTPSRRGT